MLLNLLRALESFLIVKPPKIFNTKDQNKTVNMYGNKNRLPNDNNNNLNYRNGKSKLSTLLKREHVPFHISAMLLSIAENAKLFDEFVFFLRKMVNGNMFIKICLVQ